MTGHPKVLFCNCSYREFVPLDARRRVLAALSRAGVDLTAVPDLCEMVSRRDPALSELVSAPEGLKIVACFPRAVRWLFHAAGTPIIQENVEILNMRTTPPDAIVERLVGGFAADAAKDAAALPALPRPDDWVPWFPVIDYDRCKMCKHCLNFCPFGVYELTGEGEVRTVNPRNCKDNCPACARLCPEVAIIFPKSPDSPINGAEVTKEDVDRHQEQARRKRAQMAGRDIHALLAERRARAGGGKGPGAP